MFLVTMSTRKSARILKEVPVNTDQHGKIDVPDSKKDCKESTVARVVENQNAFSYNQLTLPKT